jgi:hypothetical protein
VSSPQPCLAFDNRREISYYHFGKSSEGRLVTRLAWCPRRLGGAAEGVPPSAWLLVAAVLGLLWLGPDSAMALGPQPVKPPVSAKPGLKPEPAPVAAAPTPQRSTTRVPSSSNPPPPTASTTLAPSHQATLVRSTRPSAAQTPAERSSVPRTKPRSETQRTPAKPPSGKPDATRSGPSERATNRVALSAPQPGSSGSDGLLFYGGLALLVLVLGDAAFLTLASRVLRVPTER